MIKATKLNHMEFYLNPDLIEFMEESPDTVITLTTGIKIIVEERAQAIVERIIEYRRKCYTNLPSAKRPESD